jgi:FkbM family methyltransferase
MSEVIFKTENIDGLDGFYWDSLDYGAWWGPLEDWNQSHREVIESLPNRRGVVQAGGNLGLYPCLLSQHFEHVFTFEPDADNFNILVKNIVHHNATNVSAYCYALGETNRDAGMIKITPTNVGMNKIDDNSTVKVAMTTLDTFIPDSKVPIDLIWLDVELYELQALQGAIETIKKHQPVLMLENANHGIEVFLNELGYERKRESKMDTVFDLRGR